MMAGVAEPWVLLFLGLLPLIVWAHFWVLRRKRRDALTFSSLGLMKAALGGRRSWRHDLVFWLSLLVIALFIIGFADPHIPLLRTHEGVNVVLVMDVSGSMQATDYQPTRLEAAKKAAETLIDSLEDEDLVGIVTFESGATTAAYLSPFKDRVREKLRAIALREGKTALGDGLSLGVDMALSIPNRKKVVILLSDGVNNAGVISPEEAAAFAKAHHIQVYTVGMGSRDRVVLGYDWFGRPQYAELDEATLKAIARATGGRYFRSVDSKTLETIYRNISEDIEREKEETSIKDWFFLAALLVFLLTLILRYGPGRVIQ